MGAHLLKAGVVVAMLAGSAVSTARSAATTTGVVISSAAPLAPFTANNNGYTGAAVLFNSRSSSRFFSFDEASIEDGNDVWTANVSSFPSWLVDTTALYDQESKAPLIGQGSAAMYIFGGVDKPLTNSVTLAVRVTSRTRKGTPIGKSFVLRVRPGLTDQLIYGSVEDGGLNLADVCTAKILKDGPIDILGGGEWTEAPKNLNACSQLVKGFYRTTGKLRYAFFR